MRVMYATQALSHTVLAAVETYVLVAHRRQHVEHQC